MTHHVVCIGDLHLRSTDGRHAEKLASFDQILNDQLASPSLAAWVVLGDVFDGRSSVQDRNDFATRVLSMANQAPVVICRGNHDQPSDLDIFGWLRGGYPIVVVNEPRIVTVLSVADVRTHIAIAVLPYPHRGGLVSAGASTEQVLDEGRHALAAICINLGQQLDELRAQGWPTMLVGHLNVGGSLASTGQPQIGREIELDPASLAAFGDCPKVLGHIHLPQDVGGALYAGSVASCSYGEIEAKRYLVAALDVDDTGGVSSSVTSHPLATRPMFHVEGTLTREGFEGQVLNGPGGLPQPAPPTWAGRDVRVRYRFAASERDILDPEVVRAGFREAHTLQLDPVAMPDRALRAPAVALATTLAAKLEAWAEANGEGVDASVLDRLALLDTLDRDRVLAAVRARLTALEPVADVDLQQEVACEA